MNNYQLPTIPVEAIPVTTLATDELETKKAEIHRVLDLFGLHYYEIAASPGPFVTQWKVKLDKDTHMPSAIKIQKELLKELNVKGSRLVISKNLKSMVLETVNENPQHITLGALLSTREYQDTSMDLPCALGFNVEGKPFIFDLTKVPHLIVGGNTGLECNVIHTILASLLCKKRPNELKLMLIDTRRLEFSVYSEIAGPFLVTDPIAEQVIISDVDIATYAINSLRQMMEERYRLLEAVNAFNIKDYNDKLSKGLLPQEEGYAFMPYVVVAINDFKDLIQTRGKELEMPLVVIAQKSRTVGIHLVISTGLLSPSVLTGIIKGNIPGRISTWVRSKFESQIILDRDGAEQLDVRSDLLFYSGEEPIRIQGASIGQDKRELKDICRQISLQCSDECPMQLPRLDDEMKVDENSPQKRVGRYVFEYTDPLFEEVARFVVNNQCTSPSMVQRQFEISYNRVLRLLQMLERLKIISRLTSSYTRNVLVADIETLQSILQCNKEQAIKQLTK